MLRRVILPLLILLVATSYWPHAPSPAPAPAIAQGQVPVTAVPLHQLTFAPLVERVTPAVVNIAVAQPSPYAQNPLLRDSYFRRFFGVRAAAAALGRLGRHRRCGPRPAALSSPTIM